MYKITQKSEYSRRIVLLAVGGYNNYAKTSSKYNKVC